MIDRRGIFSESLQFLQRAFVEDRGIYMWNLANGAGQNFGIRLFQTKWRLFESFYLTLFYEITVYDDKLTMIFKFASSIPR